ncbi:MAG: hypothetical protein K2J70_04600 [Muribaculaceae bacterium]|nr:hypothetical protein [Muribaculaceae bacterium]
MKKFLYFLFLSCVVFIACDSDNHELPDVNKNQNVEDKPVDETPVPYKRLEFSGSQWAVNQGASDFALRFLKQLENQSDGNVMVSPLGLHIGLSMVANGADEEGRQEILDILGCSDLRSLNDYYNHIIPVLSEADNQITFKSANSLWTQEGFTPGEEFLKKLTDTFKADFFPEVLGSEENRRNINIWCSENTNGMIPEFLKSPLDSVTTLALFNALYFNGKWTDVFDPENTYKETYYSVSRKDNIDMMHATGKMLCHETEKGIELSLPYGNGTYSFNVLLPNEGISIQDYLSETTGLGVSYEEREVRLTIPKFSLTVENDNLVPILKELGISSVFNSSCGLPEIGKGIFLNQVKQTSTITVDESGAEAAGVSGFYICTASGEESKPLPILDVIINRPFIFSITAHNQIVIFAGVVREL